MHTIISSVLYIFSFNCQWALQPIVKSTYLPVWFFSSKTVGQCSDIITNNNPVVATCVQSVTLLFLPIIGLKLTQIHHAQGLTMLFNGRSHLKWSAHTRQAIMFIFSNHMRCRAMQNPLNLHAACTPPAVLNTLDTYWPAWQQCIYLIDQPFILNYFFSHL